VECTLSHRSQRYRYRHFAFLHPVQVPAQELQAQEPVQEQGPGKPAADLEQAVGLAMVKDHRPD
jgi:hypothetical protein